MHNILLQIIKKTEERLLKKKTEVSTADMQKKAESVEETKSFKNHILQSQQIAIIAEIKLASPTNPSLGSEDDILRRARAYQEAGADALSVVIEKDFFKGDIAFIPRLTKEITLPILEKDFIIDAHQIYEAKIVGASAILLIARLVDAALLQQFVEIAKKIGLDPVVEINNQEDLEKAAGTQTSLIAINARDLTTFEVNVDSACKLIQRVPDRFIRLGFSGVNSQVEVKKYKDAGARGVLVGTSLMKAPDIAVFIKSLRSI